MKYLFMALGIFLSYKFVTTTRSNMEIIKKYTERPSLKLAHISLETALETVPTKYPLPHAVPVIKALAKQESGHLKGADAKMKATRFEPHHMKRAGKHTSDPIYQKEIASSHCALQMMGTTALPLGIRIDDLREIPVVCVEAGTMYFVRQYLTCPNVPFLERIRCAAGRYNGVNGPNGKYANEFMMKLFIEAPHLKPKQRNVTNETTIAKKPSDSREIIIVKNDITQN